MKDILLSRERFIMVKKIVLCLMMATVIVIVVALPAEMITPDQIQVNCQIKSAVYFDITWLGCVEGLFIYYHAGNQIWRPANHHSLLVIDKIIDIYEEAGLHNSVNAYLFDGQNRQMVSIDEGGIFYSETKQAISQSEWLANKKRATSVARQ